MNAATDLDYLLDTVMISSSSQSRAFQRVSTDWSNGAPTYLGNGNLGLQSCPMAIGPARSFLAGILDLTPIDITRPALLPEWSQIDILLGGRLVHESEECIVPNTYRQVLHMDTGELHTRYSMLVAGRNWGIEVVQFVSRNNPGLAVTSVGITAVDGGEVTMSIGIRQNAEPKRYPFRTLKDVPPGYGGGFHEKRMTYRWHPGHMRVTQAHAEAEAAFVSAVAIASGDGPAVGIASTITANRTLRWKPVLDNGKVELTADQTIMPGETFRLNRITAITRDDRPVRLAEQAVSAATYWRDQGVNVLTQQHRAAWARLWESDIVIEGDVLLQKQLRTDLFYLMQSRSSDTRWSMPIFGIASSGYNGGIFWDADVFMFPAVLPLQPDFARGMVDFRHRTLTSAVQRAQHAGLNGAKYAWESELIGGGENIAPVDSILGTAQVHNNAGIALAQWWYFCATGDRSWLRSTGFPVISAIADFWADSVTYNEEADRYELPGVFSVEESHGIVDNCAYTNAAAARSLQVATAAAEVLGLAPDPQWAHIAERIYVPRNETTGTHRAHDHFDGPTLWSSALLQHPLEWNMTDSERESCQLDPYFWDMSLQAIGAAMAHDPETMRVYLDAQTTRFVRPPFGVRGEQAQNDAVPMHTGCGCHLQAWLYGATGLRWRQSGLEPVYPPCLPEGIESVTFQKLTWHDRDWTVVVTKEGLVQLPYCF